MPALSAKFDSASCTDASQTPRCAAGRTWCGVVGPLENARDDGFCWVSGEVGTSLEMLTRSANRSAELARAARKIITPFITEMGRLNEEAARIGAIRLHSHLTDADGHEALRKTAEIEAALLRIERQFESSLVGQPTEVVKHGRIRDLRAAIGATRRRLEGQDG